MSQTVEQIEAMNDHAAEIKHKLSTMTEEQIEEWEYLLEFDIHDPMDAYEYLFQV